jgi:hypothetical protein
LTTTAAVGHSRHQNKRRRLQIEQIAACQGKQRAHGHQPDGNPDPEIAAANAPFN